MPRNKRCYLCDRTTNLYRFPKNLETQLKWKRFCLLKDDDNVKFVFICAGHFDKHSFSSKFMNATSMYQLQPTAVPSVFDRFYKQIEKEANDEIKMSEKVSECCFACGKKPDKHNGIFLHHFPKDPEVLEEWKRFCTALGNMKEGKTFESRRICSRHFTPDSYDHDYVLSRKAYPTKIFYKIGTLSSDSCLYADCLTHKKNKDGISFFHLPINNKEVCKSWVRNSGRPDLEPSVDAFDKDVLSKLIICEKHFDPKDILFNNRRKLLFRNSVPKVYQAPAPSLAKTGADKADIPSADKSFSLLRKCCVKGCRNTSRGNPDVSFHLFPFPKTPNYNRLRMWLNNLGMNNFSFLWNERTFVCSDHFEPHHFTQARGSDSKRLLADFAVPTIVNGVKVGKDISIDLNGSEKDLSKINISSCPAEESVSGHGYVNLNSGENNRPNNLTSRLAVCPKIPGKPTRTVNDAYCKKCRQKQKDLTDEEKKTAIYFYSKICEYKRKYIKQSRVYMKRINKEKTRLQSLQKELEALTKAVEALKKDVNT